jgi:sodium/proline symporter
MPRLHPEISQEQLDRNVLKISRVATALTIIGASILGWLTMDMNVVLLQWIGVGGFVAALMGPLVVGSFWWGVTRAGALTGFWAGAIVFVLIRSEFLQRHLQLGDWFDFYDTNPYSAATFGAAASVLATVVVSRFTVPLPNDHLDKLRAA